MEEPRPHTHPEPTDELIGVWAVENLTAVVAVDSQSDELSASIPSTPGQRALADHLRSFFAGLGCATSIDQHANVLVELPATATRRDVPTIVLMCHLDTSKGTQAVPRLEEVPAWNGERLPYRDNRHLEVSVQRYPSLTEYIGHDILCGPGRAPIGLDNKVGMAEIMTLVQLLVRHPELARPPLLIVCRPDEEIGRMGAVEALAEDLARRGVSYGFTIDGHEPFEINVENFNASRADVTIAGQPHPLDSAHSWEALSIKLTGCKTHGATARSEGHLNSTTIFAELVGRFADRADLFPLSFTTNPEAETDAGMTWLVGAGTGAEEALTRGLSTILAPHQWRGASWQLTSRQPHPGGSVADGPLRAANLLRTVLSTPGPQPLLPEESDHFDGYSNPYSIAPGPAPGTWVVTWRLRDFSPETLRAREVHVQRTAEHLGYATAITHQYVNMGPALRAFPHLIDLPTRAARALGEEPQVRPIRGGTGVDPFLEVSIPIANLGTGYFGLESEKEFTSRQQLTRHVRWLATLMGLCAAHSA